MTEYGQAFYGSDEIHKLLDLELGKLFFDVCREWNAEHPLSFANECSLYKLRAGHWFYVSDTFKCAKKPTWLDHLEVPKPLADYSEDELQAEIERRQSQDDEITILARKLCADHDAISASDWINGHLDDVSQFKSVKAAIIAGMELQKGREA